MNSVFISGSSSIKDLPKDVIKSLENIIDKGFEIFVGDAKGVDTLIQQYFYKRNYTNINKANEIKKWLIDNDILKIYNDKLSINQKYKNYFIVENYRGNENIKYKANILELFKSNSLFGSF